MQRQVRVDMMQSPRQATHEGGRSKWQEWFAAERATGQGSGVRRVGGGMRAVHHVTCRRVEDAGSSAVL